MKFYIIFLAIYFIDNSFAQQVPPLVTGRNLNHQQRHGQSNNQENDLSINSIRNELNANRLQLERIEYSNTQIVNAVKNYRYEMEEIKKSLNKVQGEKRKKFSMWWEEIFYDACVLKLKAFLNILNLKFNLNFCKFCL